MELLNNLTAKEQQQVKDAIAYITILVAGADDHIDEDELAAAKRLSQVRSFSFHNELAPYYQEVKENLDEKLSALIKELPDEVSARQQAISAELEQLNPILNKLSTHYGHILYDNFISFAKHIAKASGGIIGFMTVGPEEKQVIDLPMIKPIVKN